jgi:molybdopterin molybdotransferase
MAARAAVEIEQARRLILSATRTLSGEEVALQDALGRVLGEDASAAEPVPPFDSSAMDGFAVRAGEVEKASSTTPTALRLVGESRAGAPAQVALGPGQAISISTGAVLPDGADAVVRVEDTRRRDGHVEVLAAAKAGQDVRGAGEDIRAGETVLRRGARIGAAELGVLGSLGRARLRCVRRPRLSLLVSGDELLAVGEPSRPGAIRDTNSLTISSLALRGGAEVVRSATVPDDPEKTVEAIEAGLVDVDVAIVCGGVSVGEHDHVRPSLAALGAREVFWGVALKPGRPTWFGTRGDTLVFGLPGNPVSAMVTFILLVGPALRALAGLPPRRARLTAVLEGDYEKPRGRAHAVRCRLSLREDGWHAEPTGPQGSHILTSMLGADALAILPTDAVAVRAGERVEIEPLEMWVGGEG